MPLNLKSFKDFSRLTNGKFNKEIPSIDPAVFASLSRASSISSAIAGVGLQEGISDGVNQSFWQTSDDDFLELIGGYDKTFRFDTQFASGFCAVEGILTTIVPLGTPLTSLGLTYLTLRDAIVQTYTDSIALTFSGGIVTVVTTATHSLSSNINVTISGVAQTDYNGSFVITVLDDNTFTYELTAGALTPDTGIFSSDYALLNIESEIASSETNLDAGGSLTIDVVDMENTAYVGGDAISGGLDEEEIEEYRDRVGEAHVITPGIATIPSEVYSAKQIPGNTRVFVVRPIIGEEGGVRGDAGYKPIPGETVIYLLRDDDPSIIPSQALLDETKQRIIDDGLWPTFTPDENLFVVAPTLIDQDFIFSAISPNTTTMQNSIRNQLAIFFEDNAEVGNPEFTIELKDIDAFLNLIQDESTGEFLDSYTYTTPSSNLVADSGEIYTIGDVTFP